MRSTFYGLEIAKSGLFTAQNQLDVTGHNMSNADTVGFTRQRLVTESVPPSFGNTFIATDRRNTAGRGVNAMSIEQVRNPFLDYQYRKENATASRLQTREQYFEYVESLFNNELDKIDETTGLTQMFVKFYNSLHALSEKPEDNAIRDNVRATAIQMTDDMKYYYDRLIEQQDTLNESIRITVAEVNDLASQIADLNEKVFGFELDGVSRANDLRDQRNALLDTLSGIINVDVREDTNGHMIVSVDGNTLVRHTTANQMAVDKNVENPINTMFPTSGEQQLYGVYWADAEGNPTALPVSIQNGALKGYMDIRDGGDASNVGIPYIVKQVNELCAKIAEQFNGAHRQGYTVPKDGETTQTGIDFFYVDPAGVTAKNFRVGDAVMLDLGNIAASSKPVLVEGEANTQLGNAENVLLMIEVINKKDSAGRPDNVDSAYQKLLENISLELNGLHNKSKTQGTMRDHLTEQRKSISSVSLDEEMTNMVRFNHAYQAASRMITAVDEELDTLINRMGLVGRS